MAPASAALCLAYFPPWHFPAPMHGMGNGCRNPQPLGMHVLEVHGSFNSHGTASLIEAGGWWVILRCSLYKTFQTVPVVSSPTDHSGDQQGNVSLQELPSFPISLSQSPTPTPDVTSKTRLCACKPLSLALLWERGWELILLFIINQFMYTWEGQCFHVMHPQLKWQLLLNSSIREGIQYLWKSLETGSVGSSLATN